MADHKHHEGLGHQISLSLAVKTGVSLAVLTVITVLIAQVNLGAFNFPVAMLVATAKAMLVILFFMGVLYEKVENRIIFATSFIFVAIFFTLTAMDVFTRGDIAAAKPFFKPVAGGASKFQKPWLSSPEIVAHGKGIFQQQCTTCHGATGEGNGVAAASLNPPPRNFHKDTGWKQGRMPSQVFESISKGVPGSAMSAFSTISAEDRWALVHYVLSLGPSAPPADTPASLLKVGIDTSKADGGAGGGAKTIPIDFAIERLVKEAK